MVQTGRRPSLERLVEENYQSLYAYAYRLSGVVADAEDLTQEAFCLAQSHWDQIRDWSKVRSWLFTIVRNCYLKKIRNGAKGTTVSLDHWEEIPEKAQEANWHLEPQELQKALMDLPEDFRTPIILFYFNEFGYREIADHLKLPLGTVMSRLARAKAFLRSRLIPAAVAKG